MNTLTWLIYFGDIIQNLGALLVMMCIVFSLALFFMSIVSLIEQRSFKFKNKILALSLLMFVTLWVPSKETYWLMVGSEASKAVLEMPEVNDRLQKILKVLDVKLDEMVDDKQ